MSSAKVLRENPMIGTTFFYLPLFSLDSTFNIDTISALARLV
jgi:hypothetical protein